MVIQPRQGGSVRADSRVRVAEPPLLRSQSGVSGHQCAERCSGIRPQRRFQLRCGLLADLQVGVETCLGRAAVQLVGMKWTILVSVALLSSALLGSCGGASMSNNVCTITAAVTPANATADHSLSPGNQVQFSTTSSVTGNCPLIADQIGSWSTSDPVNTSISNQASAEGLATCLNAVPNPVTISYSGTVRGQAFTTASLTCR